MRAPSLRTAMTTLVACVFALSLVPTGTTQDIPPGNLTVDVTAPPGGVLAPATTTELPTNVTVDCQVVLAGAGVTVDLSIADAPEWLNSTGASVEFAPADCAGKTAHTKPANFPVTPTADAPGLVKATFKVVASVEGRDGTGEDTVADVMVAYQPGHTMEPAGDQTFEVPDGGPYSFNLTITIEANAVTMVMFENTNVSVGTIEGLGPRTFQVPDGDTNETRVVTYQPPSGDWDNATVTFYTYSHCLEGDCPPQNEANITWTFVNLATDGPSGGGDGGDGEDSPGPGVLAFLAVVFVAAARARRRA